LRRRELPKIDENPEKTEENREDNSDDEEVDTSIVLAANTKPYYIDHHLQTARRKEAKRLAAFDKLRRFKSR